MGVLAASHAIPQDVNSEPPPTWGHLETGIVQTTEEFGQANNYQTDNVNLLPSL